MDFTVQEKMRLKKMSHLANCNAHARRFVLIRSYRLNRKHKLHKHLNQDNLG